MYNEQQELLNEAYKNYLKHNDEVSNYWIKKNPEIESRWKPYSQEEFINKIKTDDEFSERWGLKIEERELTLLERVRIYGVDKIQTNDAGYYEHSYAQFKVDEAKIPTKQITITYNDKKIESYK
jgi:hypothetical protein